MRASIWKISILIMAVAVVASGQGVTANHSGVTAFNNTSNITDDPVTTTRDAQGIWFIEGGTLYEVMEAMGYAVAQDRLWQMDLQRRQGRGTLSALLGPSQISTDVFLRTISHTDDELTGFYNELSDDAKALLDGYTAGVNRRIGEFLIGYDWMNMPYEYWLLGLQSVFTGPGLPVLPEPFTVNDTMAWLILLQRNFDPEGRPGATGQLDNAVLVQTLLAVYGDPDPNVALAMFADLRWINDPSAQTMIPSAAKSAVDNSLDPALAQRFAEMPSLKEAAERIRSAGETYHAKMRELNVDVKMGSYAWAVAADKTASGNPTVYSGPQMGFSTPSIVAEGSIRGGGLDVSGMTVPGIPFIIIGRTPHHAWSMQVGHAHTVDYFLEAPQTVNPQPRMETIEVFGGDDVTIPIWYSAHGPIIEPMPWDPTTNPEPAIMVAWAYAHSGREVKSLESFLSMAKAESIADFDAGIEGVAVSQHFTYADADGNIAYWMSGWDPIRAAGTDPRLPLIGDGTQEWTGERRARAHDANTPQGYYGGWNNKAQADYINAPQSQYYGRFHRAHVVDEYLAANDDLTFEEIRDLALNIATTDSFGSGGNTWSFVADAFSAAVAADSTPDRQAAVDILNAWDGHFVAGGPDEWRMGTQRADAWVLQDAWIREAIRLVFEDEFMMAGMDYADESTLILFNVLVRMLDGPSAPLPALYPWFTDASASGKPQTLPELIVLALDNVIADMGLGPYGAERGTIVYNHLVFGDMWSMPFSSRSTYAHCVEFDGSGPLRIESMFPLGESGEVLPDPFGQASINPNFFSMTPVYDPFMPRPFPLFD
ncbi:MAG: penicillin acylase family protein [Thermoanaerobaculales bacterium]|jgi:penicillin amidase|nr:penicillin acylase family protein [Thermoanaerobaculales bacterium]